MRVHSNALQCGAFHCFALRTDAEVACIQTTWIQAACQALHKSKCNLRGVLDIPKLNLLIIGRCKVLHYGVCLKATRSRSNCQTLLSIFAYSHAAKRAAQTMHLWCALILKAMKFKAPQIRTPSLYSLLTGFCFLCKSALQRCGLGGLTIAVHPSASLSGCLVIQLC